MMTNRIWTLAKKETRGYFDSPTAYVLIIVWLVTTSYFFFRAAFLIGEASIRPLFEVLPWLLLFLIPAVTMRSLAAEKKDGTLETLLSHPISEVEIVAGKLMANVIFVLIALLLTLPIPIGLSLGGRLDIGMIVGQYLGALFLIVGLISVGLFASSLSKNQTIAFVIALFFSFILIATGLDFIIMAIPFPLTTIVRQISALAHFDSMTRGVIKLEDVIYFVALAVTFSTLSYFGLKRGREARHSAKYKRLRLGTALIVVISILSSLIGLAIGGRLDLTAGRLYSLSPATVKILRGLPDPVTIKLYSSRQLPPETEVALRDIKDTITDYQALSKGQVKTVFRSPEDSPATRQEIQEAGVQLVQFNVVRQDEYQVKQGFLGITIEYRNQRETIPFVSKTDDLEYQLSSLIRRVTSTKRKKIAFLGGHEAVSHSNAQSPEEDGDGYDNWKKKLNEQYDVEDLVLKKGDDIAADVSAVIIAGPRSNAGRYELRALTAFLKRGGSILALIDGLDINDEMLYVVPNKNNFSDFVAKYGFVVEPKLLYDMRANQTITGGNQGNQYALPYPFWMQVGPASDHMIAREIRSVTIPWGQPITLKRDIKGAKALLATTQFAGAQTKDFKITPDPDMKVNQSELARFIVAAGRKIKGGGRLVVVGDSDFLKDRFVSAPGTENMLFGLNAVDWLAQDVSLTEIRSKSDRARTLVFSSTTVRDLVHYSNLIGVPLLIAVLGIARLSRRRRLTRKVYAA